MDCFAGEAQLSAVYRFGLSLPSLGHTCIHVYDSCEFSPSGELLDLGGIR